MEKSALTFLIAAALVGAIMLTYLLRGRHIPKGLAFIHGPLAITGVVLLLLYALDDATHDKPYESVLLFAAAATGGATLFIKDMTGKKLPKWLAITHALLAIAGTTLVLLDILRGE